MTFIETGHGRLHVTERWPHPSAAGSGGRDIVLVHSFGTSARVWEPMLPMVDRAHRVVSFDARNHGRSDTFASSSLDDHVDDLVTLIGSLSLERPIVVGSSLGALVAIAAASREPGLIGALGSVGGPGHAFVTIPDLAAQVGAMLDGLWDSPQETIGVVTPGWFGPLVGDRVHRWIAEEMAQMRPAALGVGDAVLAFDPREALSSTDIPVHHLHGELDAIPARIARECALLSPLTTVTVIDGVAHMPHIEVPGLFAGWLSDIAASAPENKSGPENKKGAPADA